MKFNIAVVQFPGSTNDYDAMDSLTRHLNLDAKLYWHLDFVNVTGIDAVILPGGFTYGDALRAGAIAARSPAMETIKKLAAEGKPILGICNGFQMLIEAGLLPGALLPNAQTTFVCKWTTLRVESVNSKATEKLRIGDQLMIPVSHGEGRYYCDPETLKQLYQENRVVFKYVNENGEPTPESNPNGAIDNIAGICNKKGNVIGMMPHPERASDLLVDPNNRIDGRKILQGIFDPDYTPKQV
ncbi:MAG: phosphoribosylformylglycinamidine synthase I [Candidatus Ranarchaeia archaeon]|jgi:phosphoribosylformylglycinamidine synthase